LLSILELTNRSAIGVIYNLSRLFKLTHKGVKPSEVTTVKQLKQIQKYKTLLSIPFLIVFHHKKDKRQLFV